MDFGDPLNAPSCPGVTANIVTQSSDPEWSVAQLKGPGDAEASARCVGDAVGPLEVVHIGFDYAKLSPAVWLAGENTLCHVRLFDEKERTAVSDAPPPDAAADAPAEDAGGGRIRRSRSSGAAALPAGVADRIAI